MKEIGAKKWKKAFEWLKESLFGRVVFFLVSMTLILWCYLAASQQIEKKVLKMQEDDFSWMFQIDSVTEQNGQVCFRGWAFPLSDDAETGNCTVLLKNVKNGKMIYADMQYQDREDVNAYFSCEKDYTHCGFTACVDEEKLDTEDGIYEIILRKADSREAFSTGTYYAAGKLMLTDPEEFVPLETEGTVLEKVTEEGALLVYRPDVHMYVYQYGGSLYWIAEKEYGFVDGDTLIQFQMKTTQPEKLPEERLENGWLWGNIGFRFVKKEITDADTGKYRVAVCELPTEYSITKVWTGNYIEEWIWKETFRIRLEF